ncbi:MAG TPA: protein kinase [Pyrinomonadaceae bacterium]|nr:protein kinase [Pyrinomonadaceae bacterium]
MTPNRWQEIERLFHAALECEPEQRHVFLANRCEGDPSLYKEVSSLVSSFEQTGTFFDATASPLAAEMFGDRVGENIGPYQILSVLGSGGMGTVYLAQDVRLRRKIALKLLPAQFTNDSDRLRRFQQEARAASALNHPNILTVHEIEQKSELHYIATEFIDGLTLRQKMTESKIDLEQALDIAIQVASALEAAHAAGIAHRDIKPENVMIRSDGYVKVLDFGLAKLTEHSTIQSNDDGQTGLNTDPGMVMGTPRYMSPEQARGLEVDPRTDIFSLGVMIYEMLAGKAPFEGATPNDVIAAILKDDPEPLAASLAEVPSELERIVKRTLAKNREDRYQTVRELSVDLYQLKEAIQLNAKLGQTSSTRPQLREIQPPGATAMGQSRSTNPEGSTENVDAKKKWRVAFGLITLLLVVAVVISVVSLNRSRKTGLSADISQSSRPSGRALTIRNGYITSARFAPDGKGVIYSAAFDGRPVEIFATDVQGSESRPIGIQSAALKDISSTGEMAVLFNFELSWNDGRNGTLALMSSTGGEPRILMEGVDEATFAPDGKTLAIVRADMGQHQLEYPAGEVLYKSGGWISYPRFSRDGEKIAFFEHPLGDNSGSLMLLDVKLKETSSLSSGWRALKGLAWSAAGDSLWFGGSKLSKKQNINSVTLSGEERLNLDDVPSYAKLEDISPEGRLLITHGNTHTTIGILGDHSASELLGMRFAWSTTADLSLDGKALLFYEWGWEAGETVEVKSTYLRKLDGSDPIRVGEGRALALSADGNWALVAQEKSPPQLALLPIGGGKPIELPNPGFKEYHYGSWFPDGRRVLFTALEAREDAFLRSYVQEIETGVVHPLTEEGTVALRVSPDGKKVVALDPYGSYYIYSTDGAAPTQLKGVERDEEPIQWSSDGRALFVRGTGDFDTKLYRVEIVSGRRRTWKEIKPVNRVGLVGLEAKPGGILITPDGKLCVYTYWTTTHELLLMDSL